MNVALNRNICALLLILSLGCTNRPSKHLLDKKELFSKIIYFIQNDQNDSLRHYFPINVADDSTGLFWRFSTAKTFLKRDFVVNLDSIFCTDSSFYIADSLCIYDFEMNLYNATKKTGTITMKVMGKTNNTAVMDGNKNIAVDFYAQVPMILDGHMFDDVVEKTRRYSDSLDKEEAKMKRKK